MDRNRKFSDQIRVSPYRYMDSTSCCIYEETHNFWTSVKRREAIFNICRAMDMIFPEYCYSKGFRKTSRSRIIEFVHSILTSYLSSKSINMRYKLK